MEQDFGTVSKSVAFQPAHETAHTYLDKTLQHSVSAGNLNNAVWSTAEMVKANAKNPDEQHFLRSALADLFGRERDWRRGAAVMDQIVASDQQRIKQEPKNDVLPDMLIIDQATQKAYNDAALAYSQGRFEPDVDTMEQRIEKANADGVTAGKDIQDHMAFADLVFQSTKIAFRMPEPEPQVHQSAGSTIKDHDMVP